MARSTQTVVGKSKPYLLITEDLLKILMELIPPIPTKILYQFSSMECQIYKKLYSLSQRNELQIEHVMLQLTPLTVRFQYILYG